MVEPCFARDCPFTPGERPGRTYRPHLSLAQYDLSADPTVQQQALDLRRHVRASLQSQTWLIGDLELIRFTPARLVGALVGHAAPRAGAGPAARHGGRLSPYQPADR